jgi:hypothetical protein
MGRPRKHTGRPASSGTPVLEQEEPKVGPNGDVLEPPGKRLMDYYVVDDSEQENFDAARVEEMQKREQERKARKLEEEEEVELAMGKKRKGSQKKSEDYGFKDEVVKKDSEGKDGVSQTREDSVCMRSKGIDRLRAWF